MKRIRADHLCLVTLLAAVLSVASPQVAGAEDLDVRGLVEANHAAIAARDVTRIAALWLQDPTVTLVNPRDTSPGVGWTEVRRRWEQVFDSTTGFEITQAEGPHTAVSGDTAWSTGVAHVVTHFKSGKTTEVNLVEMDVFVRRDGHWLLAAHTARPI